MADPVPERPAVAGGMGYVAERPFADAGLVWALVEAAPDAIILTDESDRIALINNRVQEMFGYERGELLGRSVDELLPERLRQVHRAHRTRYRAEPRTRPMGVGLELVGRRRDGSEFPVEISLSPLRSDTGLRVVAVVRDITERVAAEAETRRIREALDATRDGLFMFDPDTLRYTYVNEGAVEQVGYRAEELLRMTMLHIAPEFTEERLRSLLEPLERGERSLTTITTIHRRADGTDVPVEILLQAIPGNDGRPERYVEIARDITERLEAAKHLREAEQHLQVIEDRERIARDLHDIVIQKLFAAGITIQGVSAQVSDPQLSARLTGVVDDLDDTIREIRSVVFSLHSDAHVRGLRGEILRVVAQERWALGFEPRVRFNGAIEAIPEAIAAELLPTLREALSNVARHAGASSVDVVVDAGEHVVVQVTDDGRGMPSTMPLGHGLRNVHARAQKLGGSCRITTQPDGGTRFEWKVPASG